MDASAAARHRTPKTVLVVDDDRDMLDLVTQVLTDEGFAVSTLMDVRDGPVLALVGQLEPDCVLLDSFSHGDYESPWELAAKLTSRPRPVPVIMFTCHREAATEARAGRSSRALAAGFSGIVEKPFELDDLLEAVARAVDSDIPVRPGFRRR